MQSVLAFLLHLVAPVGSNAWVIALLSEVLGELPDLVDAVKDIRGLTGAQRRDRVRTALRETLDALDSVPGWMDLPEEARDRILDGWIETAWLLHRLGSDERRETAGQVRAAMRKLTLRLRQ